MARFTSYKRRKKTFMCFKHSFVKVYNQFNKCIKALHSNKGDEIYSVQHLFHTLKRSWCCLIVHTKQCSSSEEEYDYFKESLSPSFWCSHSNSYLGYLNNIFITRINNGMILFQKLFGNCPKTLS
jgi:hypothetical protein